MTLAINLCAAAVIFLSGLFGAVNRMSRSTRHGIRAAWLILTTGAFAVLLGPAYGYTNPTWSEVTLNCGVALFVLANRRRCLSFDVGGRHDAR